MLWRSAQGLLLILGVGFAVVSGLVANALMAPLGAWGVLLTPLSAGFAAMICFIGLIVLRYAAVQFRDEPDQHRFFWRLVATLSAILVTAVADHFLLFWLGWVTVSLTLHRLLLFYPDRPRAILAAHKKFIFARIAETLLAVVLLTLYWHFDIVRISALGQLAHNHVSHLLALLLVTVAAMKCAQLPVHGWLLQVVEAPTAVSALLHAGIINLGGYLLLQFTPLLAPAEAARWLLAVVAGISMLVAASVTMTRISVKVRLAWSTVAQMALMLVEISLGYYALAMLHLVAHSCYKAHAFLMAGSVVEQHERQKFAQVGLPKFQSLLLGASVALVLVVMTVALVDKAFYLAPWFAVGMALALWLASEVEQLSWRYAIRTLGNAAAWLLLYSLGVWGLNHLLPSPASQNYLIGIDIWICLVLVAIASVYFWLLYHPHQALGHRLFIALNAGLYLDEWATRLTLRMWPLRSRGAAPKFVLENKS